MDNALSQISLCTYSTGATMVREVLGDWLSFLGGKPYKVIFTVSPKDAPPPIYKELQTEGMIDEVILMEQKPGFSIHQVDPLAIRTAIEAAPTEWVLLIKLDALPYRVGFDDWLNEDFQLVQDKNFWGLGNTFPLNDLTPLNPSHSLTAKYSNNFCLFRRANWLQLFDANIGKDFSGPLGKDPEFEGDKIRFAVEANIERHLEKSGERIVVRHECAQWSVFHINVWGETLREIRESYLQRKGVEPYFITGKPEQRLLPHPRDMPLTELYYMHPPPPPPSLYRRLRIWFGKFRRSLFNRGLTETGRNPSGMGSDGSA